MAEVRVAGQKGRNERRHPRTPSVQRVKEEGERKAQVIGFRTARVFGVSQTDGDPLPEPPRPALLGDDSEQIGHLCEVIKALAVRRGVHVQYRELGSALGRFSRLDTITLRTFPYLAS